jgi:MFS family permease
MIGLRLGILLFSGVLTAG